ncbi:hypothetical protein P261_02517 [Lachnospiraceae bacterium TWA4]|nr:hypothetical protein P261_02517 [Lachnospiraceae bacterium TWA4]
MTNTKITDMQTGKAPRPLKSECNNTYLTFAFYEIMTTRMNWKDEGVIAVPFTGARTVSENSDALAKLYEFGRTLTA